jgi:hypothetical protein
VSKILYFIDVDGTVADNSHRVRFIEPKETADWNRFFEPREIMKDVPIPSAVPHFKDGRFIHGDHLFLTARIESSSAVTKTWLIENGFATNQTRVIGKPDCIRLQRAKIFKPSVLFSLKKYEYKHYDELVLIEDYGEVRRATEEAGFKVLHAPNCWEDGSL